MSTIFNSYRKCGHPCLVPEFSRIASSISPVNKIWGVGLLYIAFITLRYGPRIPDLSKTFNIKHCWIFQMIFQNLMKKVMQIVFFALFFIVDYVNVIMYWTNFWSMGRSLLEHGEWLFWCDLILGLWEFYWVFFHQYSQTKLSEVLFFVGYLYDLCIRVILAS